MYYNRQRAELENTIDQYFALVHNMYNIFHHSNEAPKWSKQGKSTEEVYEKFFQALHSIDKHILHTIEMRFGLSKKHIEDCYKNWRKLQKYTL